MKRCPNCGCITSRWARRTATPHGRVDNAVLLLHGTGGNAHSLLNPVFSNVLFAPGAPLDITKYFLILPDDIGHGQSSKPSDGLHAHFPAYDYDDMVRSQRMMLDDMKVDHLRLILGTSMGCMQTFVWGETYPDFADALVPLACLPVPLAGRNRMMRYMAIQAIKQDPAWMDGEYKSEPVEGLRTANEMILVMGSSPLQMQKLEPTRQAAEQYVDRTLARAMAATDANDMIYQLDASRNYDPSPHLDRITAPVMWINSADDFINPPGAGHRGKDGEAHAPCALHPDPHLRRDTRPRHAHGGCGVGGIPDRTDAGVGAESKTVIESSARFPAPRICPHPASILEVHASSRAKDSLH